MTKMTVIDRIVGHGLDLVSIGFVSGETYIDGEGKTDVVDVVYYYDVVGTLLHSRWVGDNYSDVNKDVNCFINDRNLKHYLIILNGAILVKEGDIMSKLYAR